MSTGAPSGVQVIQDHPEKIRYPLMEQPFVGFLLAFMAGSMNAWTLANAATFSTVQSGNVVSMGYWIIQGSWGKFWLAAVAVLAFGLGSALSGVLMTAFVKSGRTFTQGILIAMTVLLVILGVLAVVVVGDGGGRIAGIDLSAEHSIAAHLIAFGISFVAGAQGNAFHKNHGMLYGAVAVTFVVQMAFNFLMQAAFSKKGINGEPNLFWAGVFFLTLLGFAGGGAIGFWVDSAITNGASIFIPAIVALILTFVAFGKKLQNVDPTPGGSFA